MPVVNIKSGSEDVITFDNAYTTGMFSGVTKSIANLPNSKWVNSSAGSVGNYVVFAGGYNTSSNIQAQTDWACYYNKSGTAGSIGGLSHARQYAVSATIGNNKSYVIFGGGYSNGSGGQVGQVDGYSTSLSRSTLTDFTEQRYEHATASINNYALFAGGTGSGSSEKYRKKSSIEVYDSSFTKYGNIYLTGTKTNLGGASNNTYAIFAGGTGYINGNAATFDTVDSYNASLTRQSLSTLLYAAPYISGASVGDYALFCGGSGTTASQQACAYDSSGTRTSDISRLINSYGSNGVSGDNFAFFIGGYDASTNSAISSGERYNSSLTASLMPDFRGKVQRASTSNSVDAINDYLIVNINSTQNVDMYDPTVTYYLDITVPPFSKYKFTENTEQTTSLTSKDLSYTKINNAFSGYIKPNANNYFTGQIATE